MTKFAQHRAAWESFIDCMNAGADKDALARCLAENVVLNSPGHLAHFVAMQPWELRTKGA